jgi:dihydroflavonol-4-reductase
MKVFITGATGFIGGHLVPRLLRDGHELRCLVRRPDAGHRLETLGAATVAGDVTDRASIARALPGCDCVVHLANVYTFWERDRRVYARVNIEGTRHVMECALAAAVPRVVHVSSCVGFGRPADVPFTEASAPGPERFSEYARTKHEGDLAAWELHERRGLPLVTLMPGAVLGPGDTRATGDYVRALIARRMPARVMERSVLTFVHVRDVAEAIARAAVRDDLSGARYLVGAERLTFGEVNRLVGEIAGVPLPALALPDWLAGVGAAMLTGLAGVTGKAPPWGMSTDQIRTMKHGFAFDGGRAARELGFTYTPVRIAVGEMIAEVRAAAGTSAP